MGQPEVYLSVLLFLPAAFALVLAFFPKGADELIKKWSLLGTALAFVLTLGLMRGVGDTHFATGQAAMQQLFAFEWIPSFGIQYMLGLDGISFPLVALTTFIGLLAMAASWSITKHVKAYCILFLLLETGMIGVFMALDFFLFYVFWEVMLLPMYFLIGVWGGPNKEYAAIKFFLYTLVGSVLMLIAILMLYFRSDLTQLAPTQLAAAGIFSIEGGQDADGDQSEAARSAYLEWLSSGSPLANEFNERLVSGQPLHTFNILALQQMGLHTDLFSHVDEDGKRVPEKRLFGKSVSWWAFVLLFIGFVIKVPSVPVHTWLPDAHVEAPTPISMILAGILLKMGGYGIIRICYPIAPDAAYELAYFVCIVGVVSMVYGAFAAMAQTDFKRLVAYSSVSHMGYVVLGFGVWSAWAGTQYNADYWKMGMNGAMFQMIGHGISSAGMFFMVGVIYDRVHHRDLNQFGGLFAKMPVYSGIAVGIFFAGLGLPGLCGFIGEVLVVLSVWKFNTTLAVISAAVVILTAGYILWAIQRVYLGAEYRGPHEEALVPITSRELAIAVPLLVFAIWFGVYPRSVFDYMEPSVSQTVDDLAAWTAVNQPRQNAGGGTASELDSASFPVDEKREWSPVTPAMEHDFESWKGAAPPADVQSGGVEHPPARGAQGDDAS